ncbi:NADPH-dependent F420 reductase [Pseudomonas petrae]|uniref:NAD(P)-binding domain-containing protein n=1 Tax=Pseudomonas petrae TaxID=2912190 RepID=A0ABS9I8L6_9PSED|nr:NAD(P)-binding domain-containing protein [Pseudomonas petrae]MCF7533636.1 NAD(P)-binding domain-containing protein [Pseudomonas petrae]MCF7539620.1 NAD(P)-binding domain-containing protein [Pseudomonas petrae]MCF7543925.1 NAD(P)-binding domain-containing protein [Pseudomonas petrae]MCF7558091.1 NAD(P)-binding domain-containing protein [Pseudomonas petrae]
MRIGIIGAGFIGQAVAQLVIAAGHEAMLSNSRGPHTLKDVLAEIPGAQIGTTEDAAAFGDVVLVAIPFMHYQSLSAEWLEGKTVLDANNYYPERDGPIPALDAFETTTSRLLAEHLSGALVVKVFNAILADDLLRDARPGQAHDRRALPVAADDPAAKALAIRLLDEVGFDAVDAGNLDESWRFERAKPAYCIPLNKEALKTALAEADRRIELPHGSWRH